ncbi:TetR/AcrR family transcriptional regulator [Kibdelosporangium philippinense]|uniref:TetR/AcrR family transcriptional regulator n=1 Tax=Kibdelosporangium philippinense TaxID=211113 RepID=A0ABS8Z7Z2_9PSEU|nr:TetR family transcriptional regulator [Kibdelosporangium philippinense]MCE7004009.1 TetR/AcrR family transcriptional regulator [Kibdelosporangium philippinense]
MGLRERKKEQTKRRIAAVALRLFTERGFDAVTVTDIADAAEVAKATLFSYFPSKEALALDGVANDDLAGAVRNRRPGQTPLQALRAYFLALMADEIKPADGDEIIGRMQVIFASPALSNAANALLYQQRQRLAEVLKEPYGPAAPYAAAQIAATVLTLQETVFQHLSSGAEPREVAHEFARDIDLAFDLLEQGH